MDDSRIKIAMVVGAIGALLLGKAINSALTPAHLESAPSQMSEREANWRNDQWDRAQSQQRQREREAQIEQYVRDRNNWGD
jgi:hypothetical protein